MVSKNTCTSDYNDQINEFLLKTVSHSELVLLRAKFIGSLTLIVLHRLLWNNCL